MTLIVINVFNVILFLKIFDVTKCNQSSHFGLYNEKSVNIFSREPSIKINESNIVGGFYARRGQFPYLVSIQLVRKNIHLCGGSIIAKQSVLTAAHCFGKSKVNVNDYLIVAGTIALDSKKYHQVLNIAKIFRHPKFSGIHSGNDIAIIKTIHPFHFSEVVKAITLGNSTVQENITCVVGGWGAITPNGKVYKDKLKGLTIHVKNDVECSSYVPLQTRKVNVICAASELKREDTCFGDSGGALVCEDELYGVLSFGDVACGYGVPTYFCDVVPFKNWIVKVENIKNETPFHYKARLMVLQLITFSFALILSK